MTLIDKIFAVWVLWEADVEMELGRLWGIKGTWNRRRLRALRPPGGSAPVGGEREEAGPGRRHLRLQGSPEEPRPAQWSIPEQRQTFGREPCHVRTGMSHSSSPPCPVTNESSLREGSRQEGGTRGCQLSVLTAASSARERGVRQLPRSHSQGAHILLRVKESKQISKAHCIPDDKSCREQQNREEGHVLWQGGLQLLRYVNFHVTLLQKTSDI